MASKRKEFEKRAGFFAFTRLEKFFLKKDPPSAERSGERIGRLVYRLSKKHRNRALSNLRLAYPELTEDQRIELAQKCFQHFGRVFADFLRSSLRSNEDTIASCTLSGTHHLDEALANGKGGIIITGHFGNWERGAHRVAAEGYKITVVARDANDSDLNKSVMRIREQQGIEVLSRGQAARGILKRLKQNEFVAILPDQNSGEPFVPFFGHPAGTVSGPASIHLRTGAPLIPVFSRRVGPNKYRVQIYEPLEAVPGFEPEEGFVRAINNSLEAAIREAPEQWLWFHNRWKSARKAGLVPDDE
jgi:Kdo2-lipid IVA lauroyltransferase/acyltransferase